MRNLVASGIEDLPASLSELQKLQNLDLRGCPDLEQLPTGFGSLASLTGLVMARLGLEDLPEGFGGLGSLRKLHLIECKDLAALPPGFGNLSALRDLALNCCRVLCSLPEGLSNLLALEGLRGLDSTALPKEAICQFPTSIIYGRFCKSLSVVWNPGGGGGAAIVMMFLLFGFN